MALLTPPLFSTDENLEELDQRIAAVRHARVSVAAAIEDQQYVEEGQALIDGGAVRERWSVWRLSVILEALNQAELRLPELEDIEIFHGQWLDVFDRKNAVASALYNWAVVGVSETAKHQQIFLAASLWLFFAALLPLTFGERFEWASTM
jgi:hypothetical protein